MSRTTTIVAFAIAFTLGAGALAAQGTESGEGPGIAAAAEPTNPFVKGNQTLALSAGSAIPLATFGGETVAANSYPGFAFSLGYQYFVERGIAIGGTAAGSFNGTLAGRSLFTAPLGFRVALWGAKVPFELFGAAELGINIQLLDALVHAGPFAKVGGGALWKGPDGWSLGAQAYGWVVPEIHFGETSAKTRVGTYLELGLLAVYYL